MSDPEFERRVEAFTRLYPPLATPYHDVRVIDAGTTVLDADVDADGRWVCSAVHGYSRRIVTEDGEFRIDGRSLPVAVRWLDEAHVLAFDGPIGWCGIFDLQGRQTAEFDIGSFAADVLVTRQHLTVVYDEPEGTEDELSEESANVFTHAGRHCWGYRQRFGAEIDLGGIALVEGPDRVGLSTNRRRALVRLDLQSEDRETIELPEEMSGDPTPTCRNGTYCFSKNPRSPFLGAFVWQPGWPKIRYLPNGSTMATGVRRGLPNGRVIGWLQQLLFVETIPDEAFAGD